MRAVNETWSSVAGGLLLLGCSVGEGEGVGRASGAVLSASRKRPSNSWGKPTA